MENLLFVILPVLISAIFSSYLTYYFTIKSKRDESILKFKEEKYSNLLILMQGFIGNTVSGEIKKKFFEEQYRSWLYSSDEVVKTVNEMLKLLISMQDIEKVTKEKEKIGIETIGKIVLAMRTDMLGKTRLKPIDFKYSNVD